MGKRVFWLFNDTFLRSFEVQFLLEHGFEVYTPKIYQLGFCDSGASVSFESDSSLSIPKEDLSYLNTVDFYQRFIPEEAMQLMNKYFDIVFFGPQIKVMKMLVRGFRGILVFHVLGNEKETTYTELIRQQSDDNSLIEDIRRCGNRFWFGCAYRNLADRECDILRKRFIYLPVGFDNSNVAHDWKGGDKRILLNVSNIFCDETSHASYMSFKEEFAGVPHMICGNQLIHVDSDPDVYECADSKEYESLMQNLSGMFYHSDKKYHLHMYPIEAVLHGMPLVFMARGMLDELGGRNLPGRCKTIDEARRKLSALSRGNKRLAKRIVDSQSVLFNSFSKEYCQEKWASAMDCILSQSPMIPIPVQEKKIAVILPEKHLGGVLDFSIRFLKSIVAGSLDLGDKLSIVFGLCDDADYINKIDISSIKNLNVSIRYYHWQEKNKEWVATTSKLIGVKSATNQKVVVLDDGITCFEDCDYIIFTSDRIPGCLYTTRPYSVVVHDYIQHYVPSYHSEMEKNFLSAARNADAVLVTTPSTGEEAVQYAGVDKSKIINIPMMFESFEECDKPHANNAIIGGGYFFWPTNSGIHKNHENALRAISDYYRRGGKLTCVMSGVNSSLFDINVDLTIGSQSVSDYVKRIRSIIQSDNKLRENIKIAGYRPKMDYFTLLKKSCFLFHPGYADNGNASVFDAAMVGVPSVCSDYPQMRFIGENLGLELCYFDPFEIHSITDALLNMEVNYPVLKTHIPNRDCLARHSFVGEYKSLYNVIRYLIWG